MVKLDVSCMRHMSKNDFRVLTAVEMGMKNHDLVPVDLIVSIAKLRNGGVHRIITTLHAFKLIAHDRSTYDGYRLTFSGYDILALRVLLVRGHINAVGNKVGCGKESDIYVAQTKDGDEVVLKMHRLGRTCFRAVKQKRDYLRGRSSASWLYMSRLSALKEFAFMKALHSNGYPTPLPIDHNRHVVLMSIAKGNPMYQLRAGAIRDPESVYHTCISLIVRLARQGLIHCDFNEFNLMLYIDPETSEKEITLIDFPQMISIRHQNAEEMFNRDVQCIVKFFSMKMKWMPPSELIPSFSSILKTLEERLDHAVHASGFSEKEDDELIRFIEEEAEESSSDGSDSEDNSSDHIEVVPQQISNSNIDFQVIADNTTIDKNVDLDSVPNDSTTHSYIEFKNSNETIESSSQSDNDEHPDASSLAEDLQSNLTMTEHVERSIHKKALKQELNKRNSSGKQQSRNCQKQRFRGKVLRKGQDF